MIIFVMEIKSVDTGNFYITGGSRRKYTFPCWEALINAPSRRGFNRTILELKQL